LQNTRGRHAAQTVEVVRNHENGTCGKRDSEPPKVIFFREVDWEWTRDGFVGGGAPSE